jgi:HK97 gp10 family phage protein
MQSIQAVRLADVPAEQRRRNVIASQTKDKNAVAIIADFYWRFLEYGTVKTNAQPHVFPTYRQSKREIRQNIAAVINRAIRATAKK